MGYSFRYMYYKLNPFWEAVQIQEVSTNLVTHVIRIVLNWNWEYKPDALVLKFVYIQSFG